jgi:hypothetical protein
MKLIKNIVILVYISSIFAACSSDEDPVIINEEELITTVRATLIPEGGGTEVVLESVDLDGEVGPNEPIIEVSGTFNPNTMYAGTLKILNEAESPAEDITLEIMEEDEDHQFFFSFTNDIATATYDDADSNGNPIGVQFNLLTGAAGSGGFTIILRHEPDKAAADVNTGDITNAGGSADVQVTFNIAIE